VAGGIVSGSTVNSAAVYDPKTDTWSTIAPMPAGRSHAASATDGRRLFIFGGRTGGNTPDVGFNTVEIYDPTTNTWQTSDDQASGLPPLPQARGGMGKAAFLGGEFYIIGGETTTGSGAVAGNVYNRVDVYDPVAKTWRLETSLPTARHGLYPVVFNGQIWTPGGGTAAGFSQSTVNEIFGR
jgi:N-acetylneuraminic acid mutarotase